MPALKYPAGELARFATASCVVLAVMLGLAVMSGCGKGGPRRIRITGTVTFNSQAISSGEVTLVSTRTGVASVAMLDEAGRFVIQEGLPTDQYIVSVAPPSPREAAGVPSTTAIKEFPNIPLKYRSDTTSPLRADVSVNNHDFVFDLKDS